MRFFYFQGSFPEKQCVHHFTSEPACNERKEIHQELKRFSRWGEFTFCEDRAMTDNNLLFFSKKNEGRLCQLTAQP